MLQDEVTIWLGLVLRSTRVSACVSKDGQRKIQA